MILATLIVMSINPVTVIGGIASGFLYQTRYKPLAVIPALLSVAMFLSSTGQWERTEAILTAYMVLGLWFWGWVAIRLLKYFRRARAS
jgi:hypothetical protein